MPDWGLGRVSGETSDRKLLITFTARKGEVMLTPDGAERFLVIDTAAVWTAPTATRVRRSAATSRSKTAAATRSKTVPSAPLMPSPFVKQPPRRTPCVNCAAPLSNIVTTTDGGWRSCPSCSSRGGRHHVLLPFPASFDPAHDPLPEGEASDDPQYGWCRACRAGELAVGYKTCTQLI